MLNKVFVMSVQGSERKMGGRGLSKYLSFVLRHGAIKEGYEIDKQGYVSINAIIKKMKTI